MPIDFACPSCHERYQVPGHAAGRRVTCKGCGVEMAIPVPEVDTSLFPGSSRAASIPSPPPGPSIGSVTTPLLISAISNLILGLVLSWTGIYLLLIIACVFEFLLYSKADALGPGELAGRARTQGVIACVCGLLNLIALACGILLLINSGKIRRSMTPRPV